LLGLAGQVEATEERLKHPLLQVQRFIMQAVAVAAFIKLVGLVV
jgi:hypothetical protein